MKFLKRASKKIIREYQYLFNDIKGALGLNDKFFKNARGARIVCYHGICLKDHLKFNTIFLTLNTFTAQLKFCKKYFNVISLEDFYAQRFSTNKFNICLTFDDGYANNHKYVLPLLKEYKIPATFFITGIRKAGYDILWNDFLGVITKYGSKEITYKNGTFCKDRFGKYVNANGVSLVEIIRTGGFDLKKEMISAFATFADFKQNNTEEDFWLQLTEQQIMELSQNEFCTIGAHGYYHNDLARINLQEAKDEMYHVKNYLESVTNKTINTLAFPYGTYTRALVDDAKKVGYKNLLAVDFHFAEDTNDKTMRERIIVNPYISVNNQMIAIINNRYE